MTNIISVELTNSNALQLLQDLEAMYIIRLLKNDPIPQQKLSDKYRGVLSKEDGKNLNDHINTMRNKWNNI